MEPIQSLNAGRIASRHSLRQRQAGRFAGLRRAWAFHLRSRQRYPLSRWPSLSCGRRSPPYRVHRGLVGSQVVPTDIVPRDALRSDLAGTQRQTAILIRLACPGAWVVRSPTQNHPRRCCRWAS